MAVSLGPGTTRTVLDGQTVVKVDRITVDSTMLTVVTGTPGVKVAVLVSVVGLLVTVIVSLGLAV